MRTDPIQDKCFYIIGWVLLALVAGVLAVVHFGVLDKVGGLPPCVLHRVTGLYCPGCGGTRAVSALLRGDVLTSVRSNPVVVWGLLLCIWQYARMVRSYIRRDRACFSIPSWSWISLIVIILGVFVVRNLLLVFVGYDYLGDNAAIWAYIWAR